jgi:hypothetical protein
MFHLKIVKLVKFPSLKPLQITENRHLINMYIDLHNRDVSLKNY